MQIAEQDLFARGLVHTAQNGILLSRYSVNKNIAGSLPVI